VRILVSTFCQNVLSLCRKPAKYFVENQQSTLSKTYKVLCTKRTKYFVQNVQSDCSKRTKYFVQNVQTIYLKREYLKRDTLKENILKAQALILAAEKLIEQPVKNERLKAGQKKIQKKSCAKKKGLSLHQQSADDYHRPRVSLQIRDGAERVVAFWPRSFFMKIQSLIDAGNWLPINRELAVTFGADVALFFSELCYLSEQYHAKKNEGWFFVPSAKLSERTGMGRRPIERAMEVLAQADLLMIDPRGMHNTRHFKLETDPAAISAACAAHAAAPKQTPARASKAPHKPKQAPNTANLSEQPREMLTPTPEPFGISEQLAPVVKPAKPKPEFTDAAKRLIDHLNAVAGTKYRHVDSHIKAFERVLKAKEGTEEDIRMVIELKAHEWMPKPDMHHNLNPTTLTRPSNFPRYLDQANAAKEKVMAGTFGKTAEDIRWAEMAARVVAKLENRYS
jgi:uncharacterized phage protein (TIGR02220 family)